MNFFLERLMEWKFEWRSRLERMARRVWHPAPAVARREVQLEFPWVLKK